MNIAKILRTPFSVEHLRGRFWTTEILIHEVPVMNECCPRIETSETYMRATLALNGLSP